MKPDTEKVLASLKDFQRDTAEYAFRRLWTDEDWTKRFLVADEVGLGKTMVAKGVIAKTVEHLWDKEERIDIVYICSNTQIARQNLARLNVVGGAETRHADRLTLLPKVVRDLRVQKVNFVSFTPGTSFKVGKSGGAAPERVLLYWMLAEAWGPSVLAGEWWTEFFRGAAGLERFKWQLRSFDRELLDRRLCESFGGEIEVTAGPKGRPLREELEVCAAEFHAVSGESDGNLNWRRNQLIGRLRHLMAVAAVDHLEPDLVILDEFQRFKDVLDGHNDGAELARTIFDHQNARVLLLSATPFKMYTLPDEPEGDDHFEDFNRTVQFLAGEERAGRVRVDLRTMREAAVAGDAGESALAARDRVQGEMRRVMCRTERLAATPDRSGMLVERTLPGVGVTRDDVRAWVGFDRVARHLNLHDVFEYWRSTPYPLNLMERSSYVVRKQFEAAVEREDPALAALLESGHGLLNWTNIQHYRELDPGNAKMRGLVRDVLDRGAWRLAWLPPALPYYATSGAYANPELVTFTKRLIFSSWAVVPKAVAVMMSYEAERRTVVAGGLAGRMYDDARAVPLQHRASGTTFALLYPSPALAGAGDPLALARGSKDDAPLSRSQMLGLVRLRVEALIDQLGVVAVTGGAADSRWYWAAPALLDRVVAGADNGGFLSAQRAHWEGPSGEAGSGLDAQLDLLHKLTGLDLGDEASSVGLGAMPLDLVDVLTEIALAGPGVTALRALSRVSGGAAAFADPVVRSEAFRVADGLRSLFNKPEIVALLRAGDGEVYWRTVLEHCIDGCVQAVLDEYAHVLLESEGLQEADGRTRAGRLAGVMSEALSMRTANNAVEDVRVVEGRGVVTIQRVVCHFAARYGRVESNDQAAIRESLVRTAYNSPFRPFVLASTSVGQEGLDFHTYSHAIVHWNLPGNPVDLEQREGRVHRYKGHAVRKNVAQVFRSDALASDLNDPWEAMFLAASGTREAEQSDVVPFWVFAPPGGASIERYVPAVPLSRELQHYRRLLRTLGVYRQLLGQPRQDALVGLVGDQGGWMQIDLAPPRGTA